MTVYQASFTPSGGSEIKLMTFSYQGDFDLKKEYRTSKQSGANGSYAIKLDTAPNVFESMCLMENANYALLKAEENEEGALWVRGQSVTVKLLRIDKIRVIPKAGTLVGDKISVSPDYCECRLEFIREA